MTKIYKTFIEKNESDVNEELVFKSHIQLDDYEELYDNVPQVQKYIVAQNRAFPKGAANHSRIHIIGRTPLFGANLSVFTIFWTVK